MHKYDFFNKTLLGLFLLILVLGVIAILQVNSEVNFEKKVRLYECYKLYPNKLTKDFSSATENKSINNLEYSIIVDKCKGLKEKDYQKKLDKIKKLKESDIDKFLNVFFVAIKGSNS